MSSRDDQIWDRHPLARPAFVLSALALVALVVAVVWVVVTGSDSTDAGTASTASMSGAAGSAAQTAMSAGPAGECSGGQGDTAHLTVAPQGRVELIREVKTFVSETAGPHVRSGVPACYAASEEGAVVAAANALSWFASGPNVAEVASRLAVDDVNARAALSASPASQAGTAPAGIHVHGFWTERWSDEVVFVVLVIDAPDASEAWLTWPMKMQWVDSTWRFTWPEGNNWGRLVSRRGSCLRDSSNGAGDA